MTVYFWCKQDSYLWQHKEAGQIIIPAVGRLLFIHPPHWSIAAICGRTRGSASICVHVCVCINSRLCKQQHLCFPVYKSAHHCLLMDVWFLWISSREVCVWFVCVNVSISGLRCCLGSFIALQFGFLEVKTCCQPSGSFPPTARRIK